MRYNLSPIEWERSDAVDQRLFELAYISVAVAPMSEQQLEALLAEARKFNTSVGVTGLLLYSDGTFFQVLEGEEGVVRELYARICQDPRHMRHMEVHAGPLQQRHFPDWSMGYRRVGREQLAAMDGYSDLLEPESSVRDAMAGHPVASYQLLLSFSDCAGVVPSVDDR